MASGTKTLAFAACSLCSCFLAAPEAAGGTGLSPLKPPAQAATASAALGCSALGQQRAAAASCKQSRRSERQRAACSKAAVSCKNRVATNRKQSWDCITSAGATSWRVRHHFPSESNAWYYCGPGLSPRRTLGKPRYTQVLPRGTSGGVRASVSRITVTCRVRNNRIICQSSDPLEGMAITLNQWILLTARAARPDAVAPNARRGTRLPSPQVLRIAR